MNRIGDILCEQFLYDREKIEAVAQEQSTVHNNAPLGRCLIRELGNGTSSIKQDVALALILQEKRADDGTAFDSLEYQELGELYRFDRADLTRRIRAYGVLMTALLLYVAYPLSYALNGQLNVVHWKGLFVVYSTIGLFLVLFGMVIGDHLMKMYGQFLKRRARVSAARAALRDRFVTRGATGTTMPRRRVKVADRNDRAETHSGRLVRWIGERPDPDLTGFQRYLPLYYSLWSLLKCGLIIFFVSCLFEKDFKVGEKSLHAGVLVVVALCPAWFFFLSQMCERYHQYVKEGRLLSGNNPFARFGVEDLRSNRALSLPNVVYGMLWIAVLVQVYLGFDDARDGTYWAHCAQAAAVALAMFVFRVHETKNRMKRMKSNAAQEDYAESRS